MKKIAQITFIAIVSLFWAACGAKNGDVSKPMTPAEVQKQKKIYIENLNEYLPQKAKTTGTKEEEAAWEKTIEEQKKAEENHYIGVLPDAGPTLTSKIEKAEKKEEPKMPPTAPSLPTVPDLQIPEIQTPQPQASDLSPITLIKNLLCKKPNQCLPALDPAIEQAVGFYHFRVDLGFGGKLINGIQMPIQGTGFLVKENSQEMRWSTDHAIRYVQTLGQTALDMNLSPTLVVGDVSQFGGGFSSRHASHQNGLDIDIGFLGSKGYQLPTTHFPKDMVVNDQLTSNFGINENWIFLNVAIRSNWTLFAIVHPAVKQAFCEVAKSSKDFEKYRLVLAHVITDKSHFDHFHFRLKCPISSPACVPADLDLQDPGCG